MLKTKINLPPFVVISNRRYYYTLNTFFGKQIKSYIHKTICDTAKTYIKLALDKTELNINTKYKLNITIKKKKKYDIDNIGFFWAKMYLDVVKGVIIPDDNINYFPELYIRAEATSKSEDESIVFELTEISCC